MKHSKQALALGLLLTVLCSQSYAQFGGGGMGGGGRHGGAGGAPGMSQQGDTNTSPVSRQSQIADKLYGLRMRLLITTEQAGAWEAFYAQAMAWSTNAPRSVLASVEQGTALQAMDQRLGDAQNRYALAEALSDTLKRLYAGLTPEQQRTADQYLFAALQ
jgi:hypothetical protein